MATKEKITKKKFFAMVAARADTEKQQISASEVSRVLKVAGEVLSELSPVDMIQLVGKWIYRK